MGTGSTVSRDAERPRGVDQAFRWAAAFVLLLTIGLRLYDLDLKPFHHDEGVNGFFLTNLFRQGAYHYDPSNYHGPSLYYAAFVSAFLFGLNDIAVRLVTVFFGCLVVTLCLATRRWLGDVGALAAAVFLAVSPGMVFYSRYFIHEILLIAATLGMVVAVRAYAETGRFGDLLAGAAWAAWMFATKETATPTAIVLAVATVCSWVYHLLRHRDKRLTPSMAFTSLTPAERSGFALGAVSLFSLINLLLYSSFFTNRDGIVAAFKTLAFWGNTARTAHVHPWWQYLDWLWRSETPLVVLGALGLVLALWRAQNRFVIFVGAWTVGVLAMYSLTPYKTPWLTINIVLPLALLAGHAVDFATRHRLVWLGAVVALAASMMTLRHPIVPSLVHNAFNVVLPLAALAAAGYAVDILMRRRLGWLAAVVALATSTMALRQTIDLNFVHYDDDSRPYVYAHTRRAFLDLIAALDRAAKASGQGESVRIAIPAREHWPLPWYLRNYHNTAFEDSAETSRGSVMVVAGLDQDARIGASLGPDFDRLGPFAMRPGVDLLLFVRKGSTGRPVAVPP